uniref:Uncharacterized protein n=1 Tax=Sinocyclocheilus anshuiensis TaxID=1608454 RepID=A0A671PDI8_9TELE
MEAKRVKRDVKTLLGEYIGQRLRENGFDPKGKSTSTMLDDLVRIGSLRHISQYPNHLEREAMIFSSFAGMLLVGISNWFQQHLCFCPQAVSLSSNFQNSLPIEDILSLYNCKPVASYPHNHAKVCYSIYDSMFVM